MATHQADSWHAQAHEHCIEQLAVNPTAGLSSVEVINRLAEHGPNRLAEKPPRSAWLKFFDQFKSLLVLILIGALLGTMVSPAWFGLSAFVGAGLLFAGLSGFCGMARLLMLAPWNRQRAT